MTKFIALPPEKIAELRKLYEGTDIPFRDLAKMCGIGQTTFMNRMRLWGWKGRRQRIKDYDSAAKTEVEAIREVAGSAMAVAENETLIDRVRVAVEREIVAIKLLKFSAA